MLNLEEAWGGYLNATSFTFLVCKMRVAITLNREGHCEDEADETFESALPITKYYVVCHHSRTPQSRSWSES